MEHFVNFFNLEYNRPAVIRTVIRQIIQTFHLTAGSFTERFQFTGNAPAVIEFVKTLSSSKGK